MEIFVVHCIERDEHHNIWLGTRDQGLFCYESKTGKIQRYTSKDGLPYNGVNRILILKDTLWMCTRQGLSRMDIAQKNIHNFNKTKGLASKTLYAGRLRLLPNDKIMLSYEYSDLFSIFDPSTLRERFDPPKILIRSLRTLREYSARTVYLTSQDSVHLPAEDNYFAIDFTAIHFLQRLGDTVPIHHGRLR